MVALAEKDTWDTQLGMAASPVQMTAVGKQVMPDHTVRPFSHTYDFFNFEQNVDPYYFEVFRRSCRFSLSCWCCLCLLRFFF